MIFTFLSCISCCWGGYSGTMWHLTSIQDSTILESTGDEGVLEQSNLLPLQIHVINGSIVRNNECHIYQMSLSNCSHCHLYMRKALAGTFWALLPYSHKVERGSHYTEPTTVHTVYNIVCGQHCCRSTEGIYGSKQGTFQSKPASSLLPRTVTCWMD